MARPAHRSHLGRDSADGISPSPSDSQTSQRDTAPMSEHSSESTTLIQLPANAPGNTAEAGPGTRALPRRDRAARGAEPLALAWPLLPSWDVTDEDRVSPSLIRPFKQIKKKSKKKKHYSPSSKELII